MRSAFYGDMPGCADGRSIDSWGDYDHFGHRIARQLAPPSATPGMGKAGEQRAMIFRGLSGDPIAVKGLRMRGGSSRLSPRFPYTSQ